MKTTKIIRLFSVTAVVAMGLIFSLSNCKRDKEIIVVNVHDTVKGKDISGLCTYPDFTNAIVAAKGAVLKLYVGTSATGLPVATTYADQTGNYTFKYLLPGTYFLTAAYNTDNVNKTQLDGINFVYDGIAVTVATANVTQNVLLATVAPTGTLKIALDTVAAGPSYRKVTLEAHSKVPFEGNHNMGNNQQNLQGGFNVMNFTRFVFDEATPANIYINAWVETSSINTFEPSRDALAGGCVRKTLNVDTFMVGTTVKPIPATDTIRFYANPGEVVKYGKGYLAHGHLKGFYKHPYGQTGQGGVWATHIIPADTAGYAGPYNQVIDKPVDMYFELFSKVKMWNAAHTSFNWMMIFEGKATIDKRNWAVSSTSISDYIVVTPHIGITGTTNVEY